MTTKQKELKMLDWGILLPAVGNSFLKLSPRQQWKNPVMFVVMIGAVLTSMLYIHALGGHGEAPAGFILGVSLWLGSKLSVKGLAELPLAAPAAFMTLFTGLFLVVARKKALTQCLGYIVLENGISAFGVATVAEIPALVELGLLLDAFVAVFVMGIAMYHINREFDHMDAHQLDTLKG